jgi:hypothetical protein
MNSEDLNELVKQSQLKIDQVVDAVLERGYDDICEDWDDYSLLVDKYEFRKLIIFQIYENYFPPRRHEFELQIISDAMDFVVSNKATLISFSLGVAGNATWDILKNMFLYLKSKFPKDHRSHKPFQEIANNIKKINNYFEKHEKASLNKIISELNVEPQQLEPLLKLLGFRCKRKGKKQIWMRPNK